MKPITYSDLAARYAGLSVDGSQAGTALSASRIRQTHQLLGAVFGYAVKAGLASKNVVAEVDRRTDIVGPARRWAVMLDAGSLVFVDSDQLVAE